VWHCGYFVKRCVNFGGFVSILGLVDFRVWLSTIASAVSVSFLAQVCCRIYTVLLLMYAMPNELLD
jgi:hypothetical protein